MRGDGGRYCCWPSSPGEWLWGGWKWWEFRRYRRTMAEIEEEIENGLHGTAARKLVVAPGSATRLG